MGEFLMPRAAFTWTDRNGPHATEVFEDRETIVGRSNDAAVRFDESTVSRRHARLTYDRGVFLIENLSTSTATRVNDVAIDRPVPLSDGDVIGAGTIIATFQDLSSGDRISGPICSHCGRENLASDADCWYCGTSLVNAATSSIRAERVVCRLVSLSGERFEIHDGEAFIVAGDNASVAEVAAASEGAGVVVRMSDGVIAASGTGASVNGDPIDGSRSLATGDRVAAGGRQYLVIIR